MIAVRRALVLSIAAISGLLLGALTGAVSGVGGNGPSELETTAAPTTDSTPVESTPRDEPAPIPTPTSPPATPTPAPTPTAVATPTPRPSPTPSPTPVPIPTPTPLPTPGQRPAKLYADVAKLRTGPNLSFSEIATLSDRRGAGVVVFGDPVDGWYEVEIDGFRGWMFGSLVVPPSSGLTVVETRDDSPVVLRDRSGNPLGRANQSGNLALVTDRSSGLWEVILPEGGTAWVEADDIRIVV